MREATRVMVLVLGLALLTLGCASSRDSPADSSRAGERPDSASAAEMDLDDLIPTGEDAERSPDGLVRVRAPDSRGAIYVKPPRPYLHRYKRMILAPATISYRPGTDQFSEFDQKLLGRGFGRDLLAAIDEGPAWKRVGKPGPDVLIVKVAIADVDVRPSLGGDSGSSVTYVNAAGGAIVAFELSDSTTGEPLYRYIERRVLPSGSYSGGDVDRRRLAVIFDQFASDVGASLRRHYAAIQEIERREREAAER